MESTRESMRAKAAGTCQPSAGDDRDPASERGRPGGKYTLVLVAIVAAIAAAVLVWGVAQDGEGATIVRALIRRILRALF